MTLLGRGMRDDLDYDEAAVLIDSMRRCVRWEWEATFGSDSAFGPETTTGDPRARGLADSSSEKPASNRGGWKV
jgi:hypothetical protein